MVEYWAYSVDRDGHFVGSEALVRADDPESIEQAKRLVDGYDIELWSGDRLVTRFKLGAAKIDFELFRLSPDLWL